MGVVMAVGVVMSMGVCCRHQQVPVDGAYWREYRERKAHHREGLLHSSRRVQS